MEEKIYKAVFVGIIKPDDDERTVNEYLDELVFLSETAGLTPDRKFVQKLERPEGATYIRSGKLDEIALYCKENEISYVIFDDELTGIQQRNIEKTIENCAVIDRTSLILEIFAQRAKTSYAKVQVELAKYNYLLPRLAGMWSHLERQRGGFGTRGGMGETQIEIDRRIVKEKISKLKEQLSKIDKQMSVQRSGRGQLVRISLVGYTNVGKSTLMNLLAKSDVFAENKLFATLDTTVRKVVIENCPFLLSDTVGFIRKLPTQLVEAFKSTLDEVREADILMHVVDISHPDFEEQIRIVEKTLGDLGCAEKPSMIIFNKVDAYRWVEKAEDDLTPSTRENVPLNDLIHTWMTKLGQDCLFISATEKTNIDNLKKVLYNRVRELHVQKYPYNDFLFQHYEEENIQEENI